MRALLTALLLVLLGCADGPRSSTDPDTLVTSHVSSERLFHRAHRAQVSVRAALLTRGEEERWALRTSVVRSDGNFPKISEVWSNGTKLTYRKLDRRYIGCPSRCRREEVGQIVLNRRLFEQFAGTGLGFRMIGRRGSYTGRVPGALFAEVLERSDGKR